MQSQKYSTPSDDTYSHIDEWLEWYQGEVEKFHKYKVFNGAITHNEKRHSVGMAKKVCEDWANLILTEKAIIKAGGFTKRLQEILLANKFQVKANQLIELAYALGTGAFVEYKDGDKVVIDYIRADMIYPLSWDNGDITECAFGSTRVIDGDEIIYLQIHRLGRVEDGEKAEEYYIENKYVDADSCKEIEVPDDVLEIVSTGSKTSLYQIITPNIVNNIDLDSPLGISVYANSIDQLRGCDIMYDSYVNEFILGKKRILVPISAAKMQMQKEGVVAPQFDPNDTVFYQMQGDRQDDLKITEVDMKIRAEEHEKGIQRSLDMLSLKVGLGTGRYQFDSSGVKTATEVISDKSDLFQNLVKNEIIIKEALVNMVKAVAYLDKGRGNVTPSILLDDSIIEDSNATVDRNIKLVQSGLRSKLAAIMEINKCTEDEAKKELEAIAQDGQITGQDIDWTQTDGNKQGDLKQDNEE